MIGALFGLIWVQTICKCNLQTTIAGKEFRIRLSANTLTVLVKGLIGQKT